MSILIRRNVAYFSRKKLYGKNKNAFFRFAL